MSRMPRDGTSTSSGPGGDHAIPGAFSLIADRCESHGSPDHHARDPRRPGVGGSAGHGVGCRGGGRAPVRPAAGIVGAGVAAAGRGAGRAGRPVGPRLVGADTAFQDEAEYLWAGHLEWSHWLHGTVMPPFASYFSGAPVIYPPLGALADAVGGLAAARLLSLVFMLGSTVLLWAVAGRLFGRRAAFFSCALFALSGPVLHLGSFATYDAMSVFLLALAAWLVVSAPQAGEAAGRMALAGVVLALANATAYSCALFDPVVILLALLTAWPGGRPAGHPPGRRPAHRHRRAAHRRRAAGRDQLHQRDPPDHAGTGGRDRPGDSVLSNTWTWTGVILVLAVGAIIASAVTHGGARQTWLLAILAAAALAGPLEQANLHTLDALNKHIGLGLWFAAIAAGYTIDTFIAAARSPLPGLHHRRLRHRPDLPRLPRHHPVARLRHQLARLSQLHRDLPPPGRASSGPLLVEDPSIAEYYLPAGHDWQRWSSTRNIVLPSGASVAHPRARRRHRGRQSGHLRPLHQPALLQARRPQLRRHHRPRPQHPGRPHPGRLPGQLGGSLRHARHLHHLPIQATT